MAGGQWEVVGGKSKKNKAKNGASKSKEKKTKEGQVFEIAGPISESQTIYNAFIEKIKKESLASNQKTTTNEVVKSKEKNLPQQQQQKKKKDKKSSSIPPKLSLEEVFSSVTEDDLKNLLATVEVLCPSSPLVWLKDIASFLNVKLDAAIEEPTFSGKPLGYPSILLDKCVYNLMVKTFTRCTTQMLQLFFEHCIQNMVQDTLKGLHTVGYRVVLQCLAQEMPSIVTDNLYKCVELCKSHQNRQNICLSLLWSAGQAGNNNLEAGFRVWIDLMFPLIGAKTSSSYAVDYLERLVSSDDLLKIGKSIFGVRDLFPILDFIYSKELMKSIQKRLIMMYPTLKMLSYGPEPETVLRNYFPSYLRRLEPECPQPLKEEILSSLVYCLEKDTRSYSVWRQLYSKHFVQSKLLIAHLNSQWEKLSPKFPRKSLFDTLSVFQVTNEELLNGGKGEPVVEECIAINKELLSKMSTQIFTWFRIILLFILVFSLLLTYDISIHKSFVESKTGKLMKDAGLLVFFAQVGEKLIYYYSKTYRLLETYVPLAFSWVERTLFPYFELFWKKLIIISVYLWNSTSGFRMWCNKLLPSVLAVVGEQVTIYGEKLASLGNVLVTFLGGYLRIIVDHVWESAATAIIWLQSNEYLSNLLEFLQKYAISLINFLQEKTLCVIHYMQNYIPPLT